jgi:Diacylglycerol kinase
MPAQFVWGKYMNKKDDNQFKSKNLIEAGNNAIKGIIYTTKTQRSVKIQLAIAAIVLIASLFFRLEKWEFLILIFAIVLVIVAEIINTAIETVVDLYIDVYHPKAKIAKDVAAGAVTVAAINSIIVGYFLFVDKFETVGDIVFANLKKSPTHLSFVALALTVIGVIVIKATTNKGTPLQGGMPSGHAAIAFSALTTIWINTSNILIIVCALVIAILVAESRIENKIHSLSEVIFGSFLGTLMTLLMYSLTMI